MALAEGVSQQLRYKVYSTGVISANTLAVSASDPGVSGGKILRRVGSTLSLAKSTYESQEIRTDRQRADFRHGPPRVQGAISGELSPGSYFDFIEAVNRDTKTAAISLSEVELTSVAADNTLSTLTFAGGAPVTLGLYVGMVIRLTGASAAANNDVNFLITAMSGTSNRVLTVTPAPTTMAADTAFTLTAPGCTTIVPTASHVSRKFAIEHYAADLDLSRLFTECRASSYRISAPATGMVTCEFGFMGRNMEMYESTAAPFFTGPAAASTTGIVTSVNGKLLVAGVSVGVVTGVDLSMDLAPEVADVMGQNFSAEIFLGRASVSGTATAYFDSPTLMNNFVDEDEVALEVMLTTTSAANSPFISIYLPRIKFGDAALNLQGEGGQTISMPFTALLADGTVTGVKQSTILVQDSAAV